MTIQLVSDSPRRLRRKATRGFSLVEMAAAVSVIGILAGIGAGHLQPAEDVAATRRIAADLRSIAVATELYYLEHDAWPQTAPEGTMPHELRGLLQSGLAFRGEGFTYQLVNTPVRGGSPVVSVVVRAAKPGLMDRLDAVLGGQNGFSRSGTTLVRVLSGGVQVGLPESGTIAAPES